MAQTLLTIGEYYLYIGCVVAAVFLLWGISRIDENAGGAWVFRPLLIPGILLIWPMVLWRWWVLETGENHLARHRLPRSTQGWMTLVLILAIPVILITALTVRQDGPFERPAVPLEAEE